MKNIKLVKVLAIIGTILVWIPILAPIIFTILLLIKEGIFRFDFLMPMELFFLTVIGGILLIISTFISKSYKKFIIINFVILIAIFFSSQLIANLTGLASGETEPTGFWFIFLIVYIFLFIFINILLGIDGILFTRKIFKK